MYGILYFYCVFLMYGILYFQLKTRLSWVIGVIILGLVDTALHISNVVYFSNSDLNRCIVIGPPTTLLWIFQVLFVTIGGVFFILEVINSITVFVYDGQRNFFPIHLELLVTLPTKHMPLAATNYMTAKCRGMYATPLQQCLAAFQIIYIFVRMLWYAHIEGKKLKADDKYNMKRGFFMLMCVIYSCMMVFSIMLWKDHNSIKLHDHDLKNVSIYFLNKPQSMENHRLDKEMVDDVVISQGFTIGRSSIVASLLPVYRARHLGYNASYTCHQNDTIFLPYECQITDSYNNTPSSIVMKILYSEHAPVCHLGEVVYNYAVSYGTDPDNQTCVPSTSDFYGGWNLSFLYTIKNKHQKVPHAEISSPWIGTCVPPIPTYQPQMVNVC